MNIEWVRGRIRYALADIRQIRNGQLVNLAERTRVETSRFNRNPPRFFCHANGSTIRVPSSPVKAKQTRVKGKAIIPIHEYDYSLVPWRRAIGGLDEPLQAWIRYCYGDYRHHAEQLNVVPYVWQKFMAQQPGRISGKVRQRLQGLALLAVQVVAREIDGRPKRYTYAELADMVGVKKQNWNEVYKHYWHGLIEATFCLDLAALKCVDNVMLLQKPGSPTCKTVFFGYNLTINLYDV
ncbi:Phage antitermination protein Q [Sodalis glossinidius str. 'morsitans']|uniref:Phage antitermination protein Q n=1 Tax=Sodalis glossinidius (strain morsitans) TaxID=343509 RepID=Q2NSF5_SODGM|nr:bacteriophage antitermination protein Q [Sodalis glossinidius]BAE74920.1 putative phage antiterminator Q protein [Sodalis glossinidius str. 'morsitans']CRL45773.1 Phage antitermination protein Q [Sodalis glossinidius str. 'morsitans']